MATVIEQTKHTKSSNLDNDIDILEKMELSLEKAFQQMGEDKVLSRIWKHDHTVWKNDPADISNRLGWLHCPEKMVGAITEIEAFALDIKNEGYTHAVLCGMGGSSLAPEVFAKTFGSKSGYLEIFVIDSTFPGAVIEVAKENRSYQNALCDFYKIWRNSRNHFLSEIFLQPNLGCCRSRQSRKSFRRHN